VALLRIWNAGLKCTARGSLKIQIAKVAILALWHNFVGFIFAIKAVVPCQNKIILKNFSVLF